MNELSGITATAVLPDTERASTSPSMFRATLTVARRVPKEGATSESKAGVVKLKTKSTLYSARSSDYGGTERGVRPWRP